MKVQSSRLLEALASDPHRSGAQLVPFIRSKRVPQEMLVIDGPFTESKESCSHVALLARRTGSCEDVLKAP